MTNQLTNTEFPQDFQDAVTFHGHACPGLAIGYRAAKIALDKLAAQRPQDEEIVAVVENDACGVDAIQWFLGCTFGKGNLVFKDYGKQAFTVFSRSRDKGVRVALRADALATADDRGRELFQKVRDKTATESEISEHKQRRQQQIRALIERPAHELFTVDMVNAPPPPPARIHKSIICERCGEKVMETRACIRDGQTVCVPCAE